MAGIIGTKISAKPFTKRCNNGWFAAPAAATSEVDISPMPICFCISAWTLFTVPEPKIIWY